MRFASRRSTPKAYPFEWSRYELPFIDYPGQEQLAVAKRANQSRLASFLDGVVIEPGEVFSVWNLAPAPNERHGYARAAALRDGVLTTEVGGAICLLSTVLYNAALLSGMEIVERHCHSVDSYGERRYFEIGRDAAIEYGYLDLRFLNPFQDTLQLRVEVTQAQVRAGIYGAVECPVRVSFDITEPESLLPRPGDRDRYRVRTVRTVHIDEGDFTDDLGWSVYRVPKEADAVSSARRA
jgi:vancomycin resistance protein VanW